MGGGGEGSEGRGGNGRRGGEERGGGGEGEVTCDSTVPGHLPTSAPGGEGLAH